MNIAKRVLSMILTLSMVLSLTVLPAHAAGEKLIMAVDHVEGAPGDTIKMDIHMPVNPAPGWTSVDLDVYYKKGAVTCIDANGYEDSKGKSTVIADTRGSLVEVNPNHVDNSNSPFPADKKDGTWARATFAIITSSRNPFVKTGNVGCLTFKIAEGAAPCDVPVELVIDPADVDGNYLPADRFAVQNGSIKVKGAQPAEKLILAADHVEGASGDTIKMDIRMPVNPAPGWTSMDLDIYYKKGAVTCIAANGYEDSKGNPTVIDDTRGAIVAENPNHPDNSNSPFPADKKDGTWARATFSIMTSSKNPFTKTGNVGCLTFKIADDAVSCDVPVELVIDPTDVEGEYLPADRFAVQNGSIKVLHVHAYSKDWKHDSANHWHECACGDKIDVAAHTYGEWKIVKQPTESETGLKERVCSVCGEKETAEIPVIPVKHYPIRVQFVKKGLFGRTTSMTAEPGGSIQAPNANGLFQRGRCWKSEDGTLVIASKGTVTYAQLLTLLGGTAPEGAVVRFTAAAETEPPAPQTQTVTVHFMNGSAQVGTAQLTVPADARTVPASQVRRYLPNGYDLASPQQDYTIENGRVQVPVRPGQPVEPAEEPITVTFKLTGRGQRLVDTNSSTMTVTLAPGGQMTAPFAKSFFGKAKAVHWKSSLGLQLTSGDPLRYEDLAALLGSVPAGTSVVFTGSASRFR